MRRGGAPPGRGWHLARRLAFGFAAASLIAHMLIGERGLPANLRARQEYRELAETVEALKATNRRLRREAERLLNDPAAIEALARRDLGLIRPGEQLFIITERPAPVPVEHEPADGGDAPRRLARNNPANGGLTAANRSRMIVETLGDDTPDGRLMRSTD